MSALRVVLVASLVAAWLAVPMLAVPTTAVDGESIQPTARVLQADANNSSATVGERISGFMAQQTSQADGAVESAMWSSAYDDTDDESRKAALVNQRTRGLASEVAALQTERRELIEARQAGEISKLEFRSRMSALTGQYASLLAAINETEPRAQEVGANVSTVENLRSAAVEAAGPEVEASAGNPTVSPPGLTNNTTVGPPVDLPGTNGTIGPGNGAVGPGNGNPSHDNPGNSNRGNGNPGNDNPGSDSPGNSNPGNGNGGNGPGIGNDGPGIGNDGPGIGIEVGYGVSLDLSDSLAT